MLRLEPVIRYIIFVPFLILSVVSEIDKARVGTLHISSKVCIQQKSLLCKFSSHFLLYPLRKTDVRHETPGFNVSSFTEIFMKLEVVCLFTFC
jgi:hypothetical protein